MKTARSKIKNIENYFKNKNKSMDENAVWKSAQKEWDNNIGKTLKVFASLGTYNEGLGGICKVALLTLNATPTPGVKKKERKKDF